MGKSIDLVFVANCNSSFLWQMTANAIRSAVKNAGMDIGTVVIVEQCRLAQKQPIGKTLYYDFEFNYNKCLNLGRSVCESEYIAFCNNDLYFESHWAKNIVKAMEKYGYLSASPNSKRNAFQGIKEGYKIGTTLLGWCIVTHRKVFDFIGKFDEPVKFWYSDNVYGVQLQCAGIKHCLVGNSRVRHLHSVTLRKTSVRERAELMKKQEKIFKYYRSKKYADTNSKIQTKAGNGN